MSDDKGRCLHEFVGDGRECVHCGWWPDQHLESETRRIIADQREAIDRLTRERDEAQAEVKRLRGLLLDHADELTRAGYTDTARALREAGQ